MNDSFKSKIAVHRWLEDNGYQISKSQFYAHCNDGLLRPRKRDGKYALQTVKKYASLHVKKQATGNKESDDEARIRDEKLRLSLEREQVALEKEKFDLNKKKGLFIPRDEFELAIVSRAVAFMAHLNHTVQTNVPDWIDQVEGDQTRAPELVEAISKCIEQRMGDFAVDAEFDVLLEAN